MPYRTTTTQIGGGKLDIVDVAELFPHREHLRSGSIIWTIRTVLNSECILGGVVNVFIATLLGQGFQFASPSLSRYAHPVFPHEDDIVHVGPWDVGNQPIADWCTFSIQCQYEVSRLRTRRFIRCSLIGRC